MAGETTVPNCSPVVILTGAAVVGGESSCGFWLALLTVSLASRHFATAAAGVSDRVVCAAFLLELLLLVLHLQDVRIGGELSLPRSHIMRFSALFSIVASSASSPNEWRQTSGGWGWGIVCSLWCAELLTFFVCAPCHRRRLGTSVG